MKDQINASFMEDNSSYYLIIESQKPQSRYVRDLLSYKELYFFLAWRDILVRYKQAFFGIAWALFRPVLCMVVFAFIFGRVANLSSGNVNYSLFVFAGMLPWLFFSSIAIDTCNSLVGNTNLVSKIYFPRMIIPMSQIIVNLVDFSVATVLLLIISVIAGDVNGLTLLSLPIWIALLIFLSAGVGLWLSALTVRYRDFRLIVPFFVQFGMFLSPVGYGSFVIPDQWQLLYSLNPLVGIINGFRWAFFGISCPCMLLSICCTVVMTVLILVSGFIYFRKMERSFADMI